ncbi:MAG: TonB-dependent siderophore receptor [Asticcacaulis sp.]|uniref:TonB-dependent siderophore receptor n=1 Tax=Asticcacaulis sp. TaxID=1872648 RepID=UPI0039E25896
MIKGSAGATGLDLSLRQTPQSVTVMDAQQIKDFGLDTANKVLANMTGIVVDAIETDRTEYNARGFDITNFQVDGVGQPLLWGTQFGDLDTAIFDRVEAIRGATGMMTGTGNPSATINYIRKRPTPIFQSELTASYGTWDDKRLTADVSGPLNQSGTVEGRLVYGYEDKDSWLDFNHVNRNVYYGIVSWDITPKLKLTGGYSQQDNQADGVTWGGLPLTYSDGTPITSYEVSDTSSAPWTYWNNQDKTAFGELSYAFDNGWTAKVTATHRELDYSAKLLYAWGNPDATTGEDVLAYAGKYDAYAKESMVDAQASGPFSLFGREHQLVFGINTAQMETVEWESLANSYDYYAPLSEWRNTYPADPGYEDPYLAEDTFTNTTRVYGAAHLNLADRLKGIVGFNAFQLKGTGDSYEVSTDRSDAAISPYFGAVYDVTKQISAYASYSDLHNPQYETDEDHKTLPAAVGKAYEAGLKSEWFDKRLYATVAVFKSDQHDLAEAIGTDPETLQTYYAATEAYSKGYELEVAGRITTQWSLNGGWTDLSIKDGEGNDSRLYTPRRTLKVSSTYRIPQWRDLKLGTAVRWQSKTSVVDSNTEGTVVQKAYAVTDLMASFRVTSQIYASLNVNNVFDKQYWASLSQGQAYYAAPRSASVSLSYHY